MAVTAPTGTDESKGERTRSALVSAAARRFAMDGFAHTSVADIAREVGVTPAAVYRYFADKEALFIAAVDAEALALVQLAMPAILEHPTRSIHATLTAMAEAMGEALRDRPLIGRVLSGAEPMNPSRILAIPQLAALRHELQRMLEVGQQLGLVRAELDAATMALGTETIFLYQLAHLAALRRDDHDAELDDERWKAVAHVVDAALRPVPAPGAAGVGVAAASLGSAARARQRAARVAR